LPRDWTARMEATAGWRADETGRFARQGGNFAEPILRVRVRDRGHQGLGVRVERLRQHGADGPKFREFPGVHDRNPVREVAGRRAVVGDVQEGDPTVRLNLPEDIQKGDGYRRVE